MSRKPSKISVISKKADKPQHRGALFIEGIPEDTRTAFKAACARRDVTMRDTFITLMRKFAADTEADAARGR